MLPRATFTGIAVAICLLAGQAFAAVTSSPICNQGTFDPDQDACVVTGTISEPATIAGTATDALIDQGAGNDFYTYIAPWQVGFITNITFSTDSSAGTWTITADTTTVPDGPSPPANPPNWYAYVRLFSYNGSMTYTGFGAQLGPYNTYSSHTASVTMPNSGASELTPGTYAVAAYTTGAFGYIMFDIDANGVVSNVGAYPGPYTVTLPDINSMTIANTTTNIYTCDPGETLNGDQCEYVGTTLITPGCPVGYNYDPNLNLCSLGNPPGPVDWGASGPEAQHAYYKIATY